MKIIPSYRIEGVNLKCQLTEALKYARMLLAVSGVNEVTIFRVRAGKTIRLLHTRHLLQGS